MTDTDRTLALAAGAAVVLVVCAGRVWWQLHRLRRVLRAEQAAALLADAAHARDLDAFRVRVARAVAEQEAAEAFTGRVAAELAVLAAADTVISAELARTTHHNPQEGDTP
ncbi:hypothetical protein [Streptomyces sp. CS090A]|uniref:hypothetical protein n=1 Tax=Streptomyces sp. CS090A TaxID=2162710 RepID=UPI0013A576F6|nr:hypothetical protein [Streptomyces sp. CS090A]